MLCTYERTIFENHESGFCISTFITGDKTVPQGARNTRINDGKIRFTATGYRLPATDAIDVMLSGRWEQNKYGLQLSVESFTEIIPQTTKGITAYLSSGLIKGIGEKTAKSIVSTFGIKTLEVFDETPEKLTQIKGISEKKLDKIIASYNQSKSVREIVSYLAPFGVSMSKINKIRTTFGDDALRVVKEDPFMLCTISGFGFKTVDSIARKVKYSPNAPMRIRGAALYILDEAEMSGHLFLPSEEYKSKVHTLLCDGFDSEVVSMSEVVNELRRMITAELICIDNKNVYHPRALKAERDTADAINSLLSNKLNYSADIEKEIEISEKELSITLSTAQRKSVKMCFEHSVSIITGGPGTGKTTVLKVVLDIYKKIRNGEILLTAPTGRAARRMAESTGHVGAKTLHSALMLTNEDDTYNNTDDLTEDFIIIDEVSMVDMHLAKQFFTRLGKKAHVLLVGDADQLPSVGAGNVFRELMRSGLVPFTMLDAVFRQTKGSRIAMNAHKINNNETDLLYGTDFHLISSDNENEAATAVIQAYSKEVVANGVDNVQILAPFRSRGETSVKSLNDVLRELINPQDTGKPEFKVGNRVFRLGDRVLQTKNKGEISNGDVGFVKHIELSEDNDSSMTVEFSDSRCAEYSAEDTDRLEHSYAMTIHKSQGSEYKTVIIPILTSQFIMLRRNLIYTAITRAKEKVILVGQKKALFMAIHKNDIDKRNTMLAERIIDAKTSKLRSAK